MFYSYSCAFSVDGSHALCSYVVAHRIMGCASTDGAQVEVPAEVACCCHQWVGLSAVKI